MHRGDHSSREILTLPAAWGDICQRGADINCCCRGWLSEPRAVLYGAFSFPPTLICHCFILCAWTGRNRPVCMCITTCVCVCVLRCCHQGEMNTDPLTQEHIVGSEKNFAAPVRKQANGTIILTGKRLISDEGVGMRDVLPGTPCAPPPRWPPAPERRNAPRQTCASQSSS